MTSLSPRFGIASGIAYGGSDAPRLAALANHAKHIPASGVLAAG
jgi:hypothetical protein